MEPSTSTTTIPDNITGPSETTPTGDKLDFLNTIEIQLASTRKESYMTDYLSATDHPPVMEGISLTEC